MNASINVKWYIDDRIREAYKFAENRRLAPEAKGTQPTQTNPSVQVRLIRFISTFLESKGVFPQSERQLS